MPTIPTILIVGFKPPNQRRARAHPRSKNPDTLGPVPRTLFSHQISERDVEAIRAGMGRETVKKIEGRLRSMDYRGRYIIQLHRSPKCNQKLPRYFRKSRPGPTTIYEGRM